MKFRRQAVRVTDALHPRGHTVALASNEVSRHAVRLVVVDRSTNEVRVVPFGELPQLLRAGDLVIVNDAATLPASLAGTTSTGAVIELRLSAPIAGSRIHGVVFGAGDYHMRTEDRPAPPPIATGDRLQFGGIATIVESIAGRRVVLAAQLPDDELWRALYATGKPVQYAHRSEPLPLYAVQTAYAARPWSVEMPSAGRALTWDVLLGLRRAGIHIATLTHAAGLSSTGDDALDRALPWPERYEIPQRTLDEIAAAKARGSRVIAIGTTVVRALESAALTAEVDATGLSRRLRAAEGQRGVVDATGLPRGSTAEGQRGVVDESPLRAGSGIATLRLDPSYQPRVIDGLVSGLHVPGESHFELLSAFAPHALLVKAITLAAQHGMSGHELGDACLVL